MLNTSVSFLRPLCLLLLAPLFGACDAPDPELETELETELDSILDESTSTRIGGLTTGRRLNTNNAGAHFFDELPLDGTEHEGVWLIGVDYYPIGVGNGGAISIVTSSIDVVDTRLEAVTVHGEPIIGDMFNDTKWHIATPTGEYDLTIETGYDWGSSTSVYSFSWVDHYTPEAPQHTCIMPGEENITTAAVYRDIDAHPDGSLSPHPDLLSIGCLAGAFGKASTWFYRPDIGDLYTIYGPNALLAFEASIRMLRADYCGDGTSWTLPGTGVYVQDKMNINNSLSGPFIWPGPQDEAVWGWWGAMCVDLPRIHSGLWMQPTCGGYVIPQCTPDVASWYNSPWALFRTASDL